MSVRAAVDACLADLARGRDMDLSLDARGMVSLTFDAGHQITLEIPEHGTRGYAHAPLMRLHASEQETVLREAMGLNLFRIGRPGTWLAYDAEAAMLTLCTSFEAHDLGAQGLEALLSGLCDGLTTLAQALHRAARAERCAEPHDAGRPVADAIIIRS